MARRPRVTARALERAHRLVSYAALAAAAFAIGTHGWRAAGIGARPQATEAGSGAGLAALEQRVADARAALERLPALKEAAQKAQKAEKRRAFPGAASHSSTAQWQAISSLAGKSSMTLHSLEPGAQTGEGARAARLVRIAGRANFAAFLAFLRGLPTMPSLVVPVAMRVERENEALAIDATLQVFDALPAGPYPTKASPPVPDDGPGWFADPFAVSAAAPGTDADKLRLLGLMHAHARGLALFETEDGAALFAPGQTVGGERIVSVDARGVTLASGAQSRVLTLAKEEAS